MQDEDIFLRRMLLDLKLSQSTIELHNYFVNCALNTSYPIVWSELFINVNPLLKQMTGILMPFFLNE